jgi:Flp pilus assembly protein TadD
MLRQSVRFGALLLSAVALCACASTPSTAQAPAGKTDAAASNSLANNLDDEIRQAQLLRVQGDYDGAIHVLSQLMLVAADDPRVVGEYGKVLVQQGQAAEGEEFLKRAVELQPSDWTLYSALGVACDETGDTANARLAYEHALVLKPGEAVVLNNYAMSRMLAGDPVGAKKLIDQATATGSADPKIARNLKLIDALVPPPAPVEPVASANPTESKPAPASAPSALAQHAPRKLVAATNAPNFIVMQSVPIDPRAGPVKHAAKAMHKPHKLALPAPKLRTADHQAKSQAHKPANKIPSLRLAAEKQ